MTTTTKSRTQTPKRAKAAEAAAQVAGNALVTFAAAAADGASIRTSMGTIADEARTPISKAIVPEGGMDARMQGNNVANRVIATVRSDNRNVWRKFAMEVIGLTTDGRVQFLKAIREWLNEARRIEREQTAAHTAWMEAGKVEKDKPDPSKDERKAAAARLNSATVEVSKLTTIAEAWNGQATEPDLLAYVNKATGKAYEAADDVPYERVYEYAKTFKKAGAGRKADPFILRIAKALETCKPRTDEGEPDGPADVALHAALVALVHAEVSKRPEVAQATEPRGL